MHGRKALGYAAFRPTAKAGRARTEQEGAWCVPQPAGTRRIRRRRRSLHLALVRTVRAVKSKTMTGRSAKRDPVEIPSRQVRRPIGQTDAVSGRCGAMHARAIIISKRVHSSAPRAMHIIYEQLADEDGLIS